MKILFVMGATSTCQFCLSYTMAGCLAIYHNPESLSVSNIKNYVIKHFKLNDVQ